MPRFDSDLISLVLISSLPSILAQTLPGVTTDVCPTSAPGPSDAIGGWDLSNYLYVVYDETQPGGGTTATARISFDLVGGFSNQSVHCQAGGPEFLANYTAAADVNLWRSCTPHDGNFTSGYLTMFHYHPTEYWDILTLRETSTCGTDPKQIREVLFKGEVTRNYFVFNDGDRPDPPPGGTNVESWSRTYYNDYAIEGEFTLVDPPPSTNCTPGPPAWEVQDFRFSASCGCPPAPFALPNPGYFTQMRLVNLANGYAVQCSSSYSDLPIAVINNDNTNWTICGVAPEDAPWLPATMFWMDRDTHILHFNQTWICKDEDHDPVVYRGYGSVYVPWTCDAGPDTYTTGGCSAGLNTTKVLATLEA